MERRTGRALRLFTGFNAQGKSCRLRYMNHLRPNLKRQRFTTAELHLVMQPQSFYGNKWALIANHFKGRTDNEVKNAWHTRRRQMERQRRKALEWEAAEQSGAGTASCGSDIVDGPACATSSLCAMRAVHSHGSQEVFCAEHLPGAPIDVPAADYRARGAMDVPVTCTGPVLPDESYVGPGNPPFSQWPDYPASDSCSPHLPANLLHLPSVPKTQSSSSLPIVHLCTPVPYYCHVATLERAASTGTEASGGLVIDGPTVSSWAARSFAGDPAANGAWRAESACSAAAEEKTWPPGGGRLENKRTTQSEPAPGASSPVPKPCALAPPRLVIPELDQHDASWPDSIYLSPIGALPALSPVVPSPPHSVDGFRPPNVLVGPQPQRGAESPGGLAPWTSAHFASSETGWRPPAGDGLGGLLTSHGMVPLAPLQESAVLGGALGTYPEWLVAAPTGSLSYWTVQPMKPDTRTKMVANLRRSRSV
ncbi:Myb domain protein [Klebsormidium nitens]|uniref:Myb domain protein n=1 Tax=Klebsormidium nitens TaxID=105231 RepID=A0A1Y1I7T8_KLENI|nr:Myb domain protein [Klebsormidium nitens]|eukprot:GAQ86012.1 Myb domain protein [Klebsormidium nitens]